MLMSDLSAIVRYAYVYLGQGLRELGISGVESFIIMFLSRNDGVNQDAISRYFMVDKGSVAKSLSSLESKGFIRRGTNPENHREKCICLTDSGKDSIQVMRRLYAEWDSFLFSGISEGDRKLYTDLTDTMAANVAQRLQGATGKEVNHET